MAFCVPLGLRDLKKSMPDFENPIEVHEKVREIYRSKKTQQNLDEISDFQILFKKTFDHNYKPHVKFQNFWENVREFK